ncbi:MAG: efflux RND transporter periplasmic adaptor subunit [Treponema sp.]|nr:efflux RND transporter periplasmic adaptor subunit [Treponema sp.]
MKKSTLIIFAALGLTILVLGYAVVSSRAKKKDAQSQRPSTTFTVRTEEAKVQTLHDYINVNGEISSTSSVAVYPSIGGRIVSVRVTLGSYVSRGDLIAQVDPSEPGSNYALSPIYAPISGRIISGTVELGTKVTTASVITTVGDIASLQIKAKIPERYVAALRPGLKAEITLEAYGNVVFPATVNYVSPVIDAATRTKEVILSFDSRDSRINAGMFGKIKLYTLDYEGEFAIPTDAIVIKNDKPYIYILNDDSTVSQREIVQGKSVDGTVQILSGLNEGERVVVEGENVLSDGAKVHDIATSANTNAENAE